MPVFDTRDLINKIIIIFILRLFDVLTLSYGYGIKFSLLVSLVFGMVYRSRARASEFL